MPGVQAAQWLLLSASPRGPVAVIRAFLGPRNGTDVSESDTLLTQLDAGWGIAVGGS